MAWVRRLQSFLGRRGDGWRPGDTVAATLAALAVLLRWPDRAKTLLTWDSHTFALALERYDVNALRPHAPGYPVYVALGRVANSLLGDPVEAYVALSLVLCAAGAVMTYVVARRLAVRAVALGATALVLASPLLHVHAMTANSYAADLAFNAVVALAALATAERPTWARTLLLAAAFGVAVGVRQSLAFFLGPLVAWAALQRPWDPRSLTRRLAPAAAAGTAVGLAWFVPMVQASGGLATWRRANDLQSDVVFERPVWTDPAMLDINADRIALYLQWELTYLVPVLLLALAVGLALRSRRSPAPALGRLDAPARRAVTFLALWGLPPLLFYLLVYSGYGNGPSGYALILVPPLAVAAACAGGWAVRQVPAVPGLAAGFGTLLLVGICAGLVAHAHDVADGQYKEHDAWTESWSHVRASFPPSNTTLVTAYNFAHVWYYYPDYHAFEYRPPGRLVGEVPDFLLVQQAKDREAWPDWYDAIAAGGDPGPHPLPPGTRHLVLFDFQLAGENGGERQLRPDVPYREAFLDNGWRILVVDAIEGRTDLEDYFGAEALA